jgi:Na+/phosphate symporter
MINWLALIVLIVGFFVWLFSKDAKFQEIGKIMLFCGLLAFLLGAAPLLGTLSLHR